MRAPNGRILLHLGRDVRRPVEPDEIYFLEATGETTLVRLRSARPVRDVRALGEICPLLATAGVLRIHRNHAVNVGRIAEIRRRDTDADWEVALEPPAPGPMAGGGPLTISLPLVGNDSALGKERGKPAL